MSAETTGPPGASPVAESPAPSAGAHPPRREVRRERRPGPPRPLLRPPRVDPIVFIGSKPTMTYVFEVIGQLNSGTRDVTLRARGNAISRAVDVAEVVRRHHLLEGPVGVDRIRISTEKLTNKEGRDVHVSVIEIVLKREAGTSGAPAAAASGGSPGSPTSAPGGPPGADGAASR